jgi:hypothetical protein
MLNKTPLEHLVPVAVSVAGGCIKSEFRLNKLLYLADWYHALATGEQLSDLKWKRHHYGPYVPDIDLAGRQSGLVDRRYYRAPVGQSGSGTEYFLRPGVKLPVVDPVALEILNFAQRKIAGLHRDALSEFIYQTPPMAQAKFGDLLDIEGAARKVRLENAARFANQVLPDYAELIAALAQ